MRLEFSLIIPLQRMTRARFSPPQVPNHAKLLNYQCTFFFVKELLVYFTLSRILERFVGEFLSCLSLRLLTSIIGGVKSAEHRVGLHCAKQQQEGIQILFGVWTPTSHKERQKKKHRKYLETQKNTSFHPTQHYQPTKKEKSFLLSPFLYFIQKAKPTKPCDRSTPVQFWCEIACREHKDFQVVVVFNCNGLASMISFASL